MFKFSGKRSKPKTCQKYLVSCHHVENLCVSESCPRIPRWQWCIVLSTSPSSTGVRSDSLYSHTGRGTEGGLFHIAAWQSLNRDIVSFRFLAFLSLLLFCHPQTETGIYSFFGGGRSCDMNIYIYKSALVLGSRHWEGKTSTSATTCVRKEILRFRNTSYVPLSALRESQSHFWSTALDGHVWWVSLSIPWDESSRGIPVERWCDSVSQRDA